MADYDWGELNGKAVERLRASKIVPVPPALVKQAQRSWDGVDGPGGTKLHVIRYDFLPNFSHVKDEAKRREQATAKAAAFAKLMRKAGDHTTPRTSVTVVIDPDHVKDGDPEQPWIVAWKAGKRRGRSGAAD